MVMVGKDVNRAMERVVVVGTSCSGKTTLARQLSTTLGSLHFELDATHWKPGWRAHLAEEVRQMVNEVVAAERWVMDGNYSAVRDIAWGRATMVIWFNYPFRVVLWRAVPWTTRRVVRQEICFPATGRASGNPSSAATRSSCGGFPATAGYGGSTGGSSTMGLSRTCGLLS